MGDEVWNPRRETLCEFVNRKRIDEQMASYDDKTERKIAQRAALGFRWVSSEGTTDPERIKNRARALMYRPRARSKTPRKESLRLPKRATRRVRNEQDHQARLPCPTDPQTT
jgi:hypothetical protein